MAERRSPPLNTQLGTLLVLCALATCVTTEERVVGWLGQDVRLPCDFTITQSELLAVYWTNSSGISTPKVSFVKNQLNSFDDRFTLNEDFSMVIRSVMVSDEDIYSCCVELESGEGFINRTNMAVYAPPTTPRIEQCANNRAGNEILNRHSFCNVETSNTHPFNLDCRVTGFRPNVTLEWTSSGIVKQPIGEPFQRKLSDGTWEREVSISVTARLDEEQNFTCTVRGEATNGTYWSATATVFAPAHTDKGPTWKKIVFGLVGVIVPLIVVLVIIYMIYAKFIKDILKIKAYRNEIKKYTFQVPCGSSVRAAHIGVYGQSGSEISTLINSIEFAFRGRRSQPTRDIEMASKRDTQIRNRLDLTAHISLFDNREEEPSQSASLLNEEIHCPVFVYKHKDSGQQEAIDGFTEQLRRYNGYPPMVVITHANSLSRDVKNDLKKTFSKCIGRSDDVRFFENYTNSVESRQKSITFLEFLKAALDHCDINVGNNTSKIQEYRNEIKEYTFHVPGHAGGSCRKAAHIGVYGQICAGKSSFINSIEFAFRGKRSQPTCDRGRFRSRLDLTAHISLFDNRGMRDFSISHVDRFMKEIGNVEEDPGPSTSLLNEEIHCPVFVYKHNNSGMEEAVQFVDELTKRVRKHNGYSPMVVITHADTFSRDHDVKNDLQKRFSTCIGSDDVWFFENYTNSVESRQKSIKFLEFLKSALHHCDVSVVNSERQKGVKPKEEEKRKGRWWLFGW